MFPRATGWRVGLALAGVLGFFAAAMAVAVVTLDRLAAAETELTLLDGAKHSGHRVAAQLREQYIHQAHTIIEWDDSHLEHYDEALEQTRQAIARLRASAQKYGQLEAVEQVSEGAEASDRHFRTTALAALESDARARAPAINQQLETIMGRATARVADLNLHFEEKSREARLRAAQLRTQAKLLILCCFGCAFLIAGLVGAAILRFVVRKLAILQEGAVRIGSGDLSARIQMQGEDEFGELATAFNRMAADLGRHQEDLVRTQRLASIGQVAAGIAHELNNPLGVILGYLRVMRRRGENATSDDLDVIADEATQCQKTVQGLLELASPRGPDLAEMDLAALARESVERMAETGRLDDLHVQQPPDGTELRIIADEAMVRQVISNLLVNGSEASPPGGTLSIGVARDTEGATLTVQDSGTGFSPEAVERAFEPFFTTKTSGSGLGLAIARANVEAHGGRIEIAPPSSEGARVIAHFPLAGTRNRNPSS